MFSEYTILNISKRWIHKINYFQNDEVSTRLDLISVLNLRFGWVRKSIYHKKVMSWECYFLIFISAFGEETKQENRVDDEGYAKRFLSMVPKSFTFGQGLKPLYSLIMSGIVGHDVTPCHWQWHLEKLCHHLLPSISILGGSHNFLAFIVHHQLLPIHAIQELTNNIPEKDARPPLAC